MLASVHTDFLLYQNSQDNKAKNLWVYQKHFIKETVDIQRAFFNKLEMIIVTQVID